MIQDYKDCRILAKDWRIVICACCMTDMEEVVQQRFENLGIDIKEYENEESES